MRTRFIAALALSAGVLIGQQSFACDRARAATYNYEDEVGGSPKIYAIKNVSPYGTTVTYFASNPGNTYHTTTYTTRTRSRNSVAFGGSSYSNSRRAHSNNDVNSNYTYAFGFQPGWDPNRDYDWKGHHYTWTNNGWYITDSYPYSYSYTPGYYGSSISYNSGTYTAMRVQQGLADSGYDPGPIDGIVGPRTEAAVAAYQRDNSLPITGTIDQNLLSSLQGG